MLGGDMVVEGEVRMGDGVESGVPEVWHLIIR
jgi:hypothetical protein